jgi:F-type H+-transporting ATPase subunit alpha
MKLDYLQFQELEIFTRFGSRLEASVEAKIRRGRLLRELLKQDRLAPLAPEQHMAWLVAYNEGLFDGLDSVHLAESVATLFTELARHPLTLDDPRESWLAAVRLALAGAGDEPAA